MGRPRKDKAFPHAIRLTREAHPTLCLIRSANPPLSQPTPQKNVPSTTTPIRHRITHDREIYDDDKMPDKYNTDGNIFVCISM